MKILVKSGTTSKSAQFKVKNTSGNGVAGLVAADFTASYFILGAAAEVAITLSDLAALTTAFTSGGVFEIGNGKYRLDVPNAVYATIGEVTISIVSAGRPDVDIEFQCTAFDPTNANLGLTGLTGLTAPGTAAGLVQNQDLPSESDQAQTTSEYIDANSVMASEVTSVKAVTDKVNTALESDGVAGYQYTELALENAPSGTGGDATEANQTTILANQAIIDGKIDIVQTDLDNPDQYKADVSLLAVDSTVAKEATKFAPDTDVVAHVTLVDNVTTNTDMVDEPDNQGIVDIEAKVDLLQVDSTQSLLDTGTTIPTLINAIPTDGNIVSVAGSAVASVDDFKATGFNTVVPDEAGIAAALHVITDDKVDTMQIDVTMLRGMTSGSWAFINNQWIFYNEAGTEINRYNMTKDGVLNTDAPDARTLV